MATLREQIATNVLTVTRFRELMKKLRENRPNDDLNLVKKAYEFSRKTTPDNPGPPANPTLSILSKSATFLPT